MQLTARSLEFGHKAPLGTLDHSWDGPGLTAVIGKNGAGKSTLLHTLAGLRGPIAGVVALGDKPLLHWSVQERATRLAVVLTERHALGGLTIRDLVEMGRHPHPRSPEDAPRILAAMEAFGIDHIAHKALDEVSDGERQRAQLARVRVQDTPYVFLDEPTAFLDYHGRVQLLSVLKEWSKEVCIIFSTHDLEQLSRIDAALIECGPTVQVYGKAAGNSRVREIIASAAERPPQQ